MNKFLFLPLLFLIIVIVLLFAFQAEESPSVVEAAGGNVTGWAWLGADKTAGGDTDPLGWVSFSSSNSGISCHDSTYGVNVNYDTGEISGAAFIGVGEDSNDSCQLGEETVGWLYFDTTDVPSQADSGDYARIEGNEIKGWAPIKTNDGNDILTWVHFDGSNYSNVITGDGTIGNSDSSHYAWAGLPGDVNGGLGWIDLNPYRDDGNIPGDEVPDQMSEDDTVHFPPVNQEPEVHFNSDDFSSLEFDTVHTYYCETSGTGRVDLKWAYYDPDGDQEEKAELQVLSGGNVVLTNTISNPPSGNPVTNGQILYVTTDLSENLNFGETYTWKVKVYSEDGEPSDWINASGYSFTTPVHPWPYPEFEVQPDTPEIETQATFKDYSQCYDSATNDGHPCSEDSNVDYRWYFDYENDKTVDSTYEGSATNTYMTMGDYRVRLEVEDELGSCSFHRDIMVTLPLPDWEEVPSR